MEERLTKEQLRVEPTRVQNVIRKRNKENRSSRQRMQEFGEKEFELT